MRAIIIDGVKYIGLIDKHNLKSLSLEHNIYFTLRDIFWNGDERNGVEANLLIDVLVGDEKTYYYKGFGFTDALHKNTYNFTENLFIFLIHISQCTFEFAEVKKYNDIFTEYILFDDWQNDLQTLISELRNLIQNMK